MQKLQVAKKRVRKREEEKKLARERSRYRVHPNVFKSMWFRVQISLNKSLYGGERSDLNLAGRRKLLGNKSLFQDT